MKKIILSLLLVTLAAPAWASEGEGGIPYLELIAAVVNFGIFVFILVRYGGPAIKKNFAGKAREYQEKVREANALLAEAERLHQEWSARHKNLEAEAQRIREDAKRLAEVQANEIVENAKVQAKRLLADAERAVANDLLRAKDDLRREMVENLVAKAEEKLRARLAPSHQRALIDDAMRKLEATE